MPMSRSRKTPGGFIVRHLSFAVTFLAIVFASLQSSNVTFAQSASTPTTINVSNTAKLTNARRLGVNLGTQDFWDSGQMMRQIMFRNPGFEGEQWQSILHCKYVTATSCTDDDIYTGWPANFLKGATVEFILGKAIGTFATVTSSTIADQAAGTGVTVNLSGVSIAPSIGDFLVARFEVPGNAQGGWWENLSSGATLSTEFTDLSPNTPGKQALRVTVPAGQTATISSYTDGYAGRSFLQMNGSYTLTFRAKSTGGSTGINVSVTRIVDAPPAVSYFNQNVTLTTSWQDYSYTFTASDVDRYGNIQLQFAMNGASVLLDDVALTAAASSENPTNYRNEVVTTLQKLKPGTLRYMDSGVNWGSSIDNMLAVDFAREPTGYSNFNELSTQIPMGLNDFLQLCAAVGTEPWYTMPTGMSLQEMSNLMDFLGGSTSTTYGAKRAAMGQTAPWTSVFKTIHLEFGNEVWNTANPGASMNDPIAYGQRAGMIFTTAKASAAYSAKSFDFIVDGFEVVPSWNQIVLENSSNYDTIDVASYIFTSFNDTSSIENIYGPMFAEPEMQVDTATGVMNEQAAVAASATTPANLAVYETNISTGNGSATQAAVNSTVPSVGAGITASLNLLMAMRDLGVNNQNMFALTGYQFTFYGTNSAAATLSPIWASVIDMGGQSNLQRPNFLSEQLANSAILPTLLSTSQTGANPTWNQPLSTNDGVVLPGAHYVQSFAYTDGTTLNVIAFNLSRTTALPITFAGLNAPTGAATISTLTGSSILASNESGENVAITSKSATLEAGSTLTLPPYSMTVISVGAPAIPAEITAISVDCARSTLSPGNTTSCTPTVTGQGSFNSGVSWAASAGTITSAGVYTASSTIPSSGAATITATSLQDSTKQATFPITIAADAIIGVKVSCSVASLGQGLNTNCAATVSGTGSFSNAYTWSVSGGNITPAGYLTAPVTGTSVTVTATSTQDTTKKASATIALTPVLTITNPVVTTTSTSFTASWTTNMLARNGIVYGLTGGVTGGTPYDNNQITNPSYTVSGLKPGATYTLLLSSYTVVLAPSTLPIQTASDSLTITLPATSSTPTTPRSTITGVKVSCTQASILQSGTTSCGTVVTGTQSFAKTVAWSVSAGSITSAGVVTAPASGTSITVKATSTQDSTKSGTFVITLNPVLTIADPVTTTTSTTVTATWADNLAAENGVVYGLSGSTTTKNVYNTTPTKSPSFTITGLTPGAKYSLTLVAYLPTQTITKAVTVTLPASPSAAAAVTAVALSCGASSIVQGQTTTCTTSVKGTTSTVSQAVKLTATAGTISGTTVTAPTTGTSIKVVATSVQDPTKSASYTIALQTLLTIADPVVKTTSTSITANWTTNMAVRHGISYGIAGGSSVGTPYDGREITDPSFTLTGLKPGATYTLLLTSYTVVLAPYNIPVQSTFKSVTVTLPKD